MGQGAEGQSAGVQDAGSRYVVVHDVAVQDVVAPSENLNAAQDAALGAAGHEKLDVKESAHVVSEEVAADHVVILGQAHERIVHP